MNVKSAFLNRILQNKAYVEQPKGFIDPKFPYYIFKLNKALYGLKQAPRNRLMHYFLEHDFLRGGANRTLFIRCNEETITITQIYVDNIIFGFPIDSIAHEFIECM